LLLITGPASLPHPHEDRTMASITVLNVTTWGPTSSAVALGPRSPGVAFDMILLWFADMFFMDGKMTYDFFMALDMFCLNGFKYDFWS
jgi:hypothetical protein